MTLLRADLGEQPAPDELRTLIQPLLPAGWRAGFEPARMPSGFVVRARSEEGALHVLEARRRKPGRQGLVDSDLLTYGYRTEDPVIAERPPVDLYREVIAALRGAEPALIAFLPDEAESLRSVVREERGGAHFFVEEDALSSLVWQARGRKEHLRRLIHELLAANLPEDEGTMVSVYLKNPCAQSCEFCELPMVRNQPGARVRRGLEILQESAGFDIISQGALDAVLEEAGARNSPPVLVLTGNDWARHPRVDEILARFERERRVPVSLYGPSTRLAERLFAQRVARLPTLREVRLTLESSNSEEHDAITGAPGSGRAVLQAITELRAAGVQPGINVVLTARAVHGLAAHLEWLAAQRLRVRLLEFFPDRTQRRFAPQIFASMDLVRAQLELASPQGHAAVECIVGLPHCAVPLSLRDRLLPIWRAPNREPALFPSSCSSCSQRSRCSGVPETYAKHFGARGLRPE